MMAVLVVVAVMMGFVIEYGGVSGGGGDYGLCD